MKALTPSQFTENYIYIEGEPFRGDHGFEAFPYLRDIYDSNHQFKILKAGRQVAKTSTLGNLLLCYSILIPGCKSLYVCPTQFHVQLMSNDRINMVVQQSPLLKKFTSNKLVYRVTEKMFINNSIIRLRSTFHTARPIRGISARIIMIDEIQEIDTDLIPVILECAATYPANKMIYFAGTPLSFDNTIEYYWSKKSTMMEWMTKCSCGQWNKSEISNIGVDGYICKKCSKLLDIRQGEWVAGNRNAPYAGFHIPQLLSPFAHMHWESIKQKYSDYGLRRFMNEVLGESFEEGSKPITRSQLAACCKNYDPVEKPSHDISGRVTVAGIDWGSGENSFTVLTIFSIENEIYKVWYMKRFSGIESLPESMLDKIKRMLNLFNVNKVGCDSGFGYIQNNELIKEFGVERVVPITYSNTTRSKIKWDKKGVKLVVNKYQILEDIFEMLKKQEIIFFKEEVFMKEFADDFLGEFIEEDSKNNRLRFDHPSTVPDDALHSLVYAVLAAQFIRPKLSLFNPGVLADGRVP